MHQEILTLIDNGELEAAGAQLTSILQSNPDDIQALQISGRLAARMGQYQPATNHLQKAVSLSDRPELKVDLARVLGRTGDLDQAINLCKNAMTNTEADWQAHYLLGQLYVLGQNAQESVSHLTRAVQLNPVAKAPVLELAQVLEAAGAWRKAAVTLKHYTDHIDEDPSILHRLGLNLHRAGMNTDALEVFLRWAQLEPVNADSHISAGTMYQLLGQYDAAEGAYRKALDLDSGNTNALTNMGSVYRARRQLEPAKSWYRKALDIDPLYPDALAGIASAMEMEGQYEDALEVIEKATREGKISIELTIMYARVLRRVGSLDKAAEVLEARIGEQAIMPKDQSRLYFVLGDVLDESQQFDEAMAAYQKANTLKNISYDPDVTTGSFKQVSKFFTPERKAQLATNEFSGQRLVFVVGMPRSGTSLLEQTLACHGSVGAAGELENIAQLALSFPVRGDKHYPEYLEDVSADELHTAAGKYLETIKQVAGQHEILIDKMPGNFVHLGFIEMMFPDAQILHCTRQPLDNCLSLYFQDFAGLGMLYSYKLTDIARYYEDYHQLMKHFLQTSNLEILTVPYESMVGDHEAQARRVCEFLDLPWDPQCLNFHRSSRVVQTASHAQVRKPIYTGSVNRSEHYAEHLDEIRSMLDTLIHDPLL